MVDAANSIMSRTQLLLSFAAAQRLGGSAAWRGFLRDPPREHERGPSARGGRGEAARARGGAGRGGGAPPQAPSGQAMAWDKVVLSGWSRGSAYPVHISKYFAAPRWVPEGRYLVPSCPWAS